MANVGHCRKKTFFPQLLIPVVKYDRIIKVWTMFNNILVPTSLYQYQLFLMDLHDSESFPDTIQMFIRQLHTFVLLHSFSFTGLYAEIWLVLL